MIGKQAYITNTLGKRVKNKLTGKKSPIQIKNRFAWIDILKPDKVLVNASTAISLSHFPDLVEWMIQTSTKYCTLIQHHFESGILTDFQNNTLKKILLCSRQNFFVAERNINVLERQLLFKIPNVKLVQNPINISCPKIIDYPETSILQMAVVARLECNYKGQDILIQALASEIQNFSNFHINLYGKGPDHQHLQNLIKFYCLEDHITLMGHFNSITSIWKENHILLLPSLSEGTPISLIEAMCCGRCAIVTDVGDNAKFVKDNVTGFVAAAATVAELKKVLHRALKINKNWREMGLHSFELALKVVDNSPELTLLQLIKSEL